MMLKEFFKSPSIYVLEQRGTLNEKPRWWRCIITSVRACSWPSCTQDPLNLKTEEKRHKEGEEEEVKG